MSLGLYLHIPYCFSKCRYCDFYSHPGERGVPEAYVGSFAGAFPLCAGSTSAAGHPLFWRRHAQPAAPGAGKTADRCGSAPARSRDHAGSKPGDGDRTEPCGLPGGGSEPHLLRGCSLPGTPSCAHWAGRTRQNRHGLPLPPLGGQALRTSAATSCWHCPTTPKPSLTKRWN